MTLRNKRGQESKRQLRLQVIEVENDGDQTTVTVFLLGVAFNVANLAVLVVAIFRLGLRRPHPVAA